MISRIVSGQILADEKTRKQLPYILFLAFIGLFYIANSYQAEKRIRKIEKLQKEVKELRYDHIYTRSVRVSKSRQSEIARTLAGKGIKESMVPPKKIELEK